MAANLHDFARSIICDGLTGWGCSAYYLWRADWLTILGVLFMTCWLADTTRSIICDVLTGWGCSGYYLWRADWLRLLGWLATRNLYLKFFYYVSAFYNPFGQAAGNWSAHSHKERKRLNCAIPQPTVQHFFTLTWVFFYCSVKNHSVRLTRNKQEGFSWL